VKENVFGSELQFAVADVNIVTSGVEIDGEKKIGIDKEYGLYA